MDEFILELVEDYNNYSELAQLCYSKQKEGKCDEGMLEWNHGQWYCLEKCLKSLEEKGLVKLKWECKEHTFGYDDWKRQLTYRTVEIIAE